jgi:hypothetical protein
MAGFPFCELKMLFATRNYTEGAAREAIGAIGAAKPYFLRRA